MARPTQSAMTFALPSARAHSAPISARRLRPFQRVEIVLDAQHRRCVDGFALEDALDELAAFSHAENLRQRPRRRVAFKPRDCARREDEHAVRGFAAQRLLPGEGHDVELRPFQQLRECGRGRVADGEASAVGGDPIGTRNAHARRCSVPSENDVASRIDLCQVGQVAVPGLECGDVLELELVDDVVDPTLAERFPGNERHWTRAKQRPERHFDRASIGGGHDADSIIGGNRKDFAREVDGALELRFARFRAVRASENGAGEVLQAPAGALGAGTGRKVRHGRPHGGRSKHDCLSFQIGAPRWGGVSRLWN